MLRMVPGYPQINRRITRDASRGCWRVRTHRPDGYAELGKQGLVHRLAYTAFTGRAIPAGYQIHHACGTRNCVNPDHLVLVTASEHTHLHHGHARPRDTPPEGNCRHGHSWAEWGVLNSQGNWACRLCYREAWRRADAKRRQNAPISTKRL